MKLGDTSINMTCKECLKKMDAFIQGEFDVIDAANFAEHIKSCKTCYDELEITYCMQTAVRQLTLGEEITGDYRGKLRNGLERAIEDYKSFRIKLKRKRVFVIIYLIFMGVLTGLSLF